mmetsp:Transcript_39864/g.95355  ORF Transcript_39864/g.95355 Transcript_39864/m.95355 type:complete len:354 (+) Transcript_39864:1131-2192(+)
MVNGVENHLLQAALRLLKATDVIPLDVRHLDHCFTQGGGVALAHGRSEVLLRHKHGVQDLSVDGLLLQIDEVHLLSDARECGLSAQLCQVCAHKAVRVCSDILQLDIWAQLHIFGVDPHDLQAAVVVRHTNVELPVEAPKAAQGLVNGVGPIRGADDHGLPATLHAIHQGQHLGNHAPLDLTACLVALRRDRVDLVDEDDAGSGLLGVGEEVAHARGADAREDLHKLRGRDAEERHACLTGHSLCEQGLSGARRPDQQSSLRDLRAELRVARRVLQEVHDLHELFFSSITARNIIELDVGVAILHNLCWGLAKLEWILPTHARRTTAHANTAKEQQQACNEPGNGSGKARKEV